MMDLDFMTLMKYVVLAGATQILLTVLFKIFIHPLADFPGPKWAAATDWYKTYQEAVCQKSWFTVLEELHAKYGPIVRVGPSELHFKNLKAYDDIYNNSNRWDKDPALYRCFGEDHSSFGYLTYAESKERKDALNPLFSYRAICSLQDLVQSKVDRFCDIIKTTNAAGKSSDLYFGFRCFTVDTVTSCCFAKSVDALDVPDFKAPIVEAMEASNPAFIIFKHFSLIRNAVFNMPPWLSVRVSPQTSGLIDLQQMLIHQVKDVVENPKILENAPHKVIYHQLLDEKAYKSGKIPARGHLYEEAQTLVFAGTDTTGNTLMVGVFYLLENENLVKRLKDELQEHWPNLEKAPRYEDLQKLPFLTAIIKECLRITPGVTTPLPRIVPGSGATIDGTSIPAGTSVGMSSVFVHMSEEIFEDPTKFDPDRWLRPDSASFEKWIVAFSKGPRACMGQNLAWCELYLMFAALFRRFDMELDGMSLADLKWRDTFLPHFQGRHLQVFCRPVAC